MPPLTGGMVGYIGYDAVRWVERLPELADRDIDIPELTMLLATDLAAFDHHEGTVTLIANAVNWDDSPERVDAAYDDARERLNVMTERLAAPAPATNVVFSRTTPEFTRQRSRSEEHTSELQSRENLVCRLLLEKKKKTEHARTEAYH